MFFNINVQVCLLFLCVCIFVALFFVESLPFFELFQLIRFIFSHSLYTTIILFYSFSHDGVLFFIVYVFQPIHHIDIPNP